MGGSGDKKAFKAIKELIPNNNFTTQFSFLTKEVSGNIKDKLSFWLGKMR